jgi:menaquinone-dependent protoporphyrinogen IX oxidase
MSATSKPRVLVAYYTYTQQTLKVAEAMADALVERGCDVRLAGIEFTDQRYAERFTRLPLKHAYGDVLGMAPAQLRAATGEIRIPPEAQGGEYDLICVGSPTWFFRPSVPIRSFLKSDEAGGLLDGTRFAVFVVCRRYWSINLKAVKKLAIKRGGKYVNGAHFTFAGRQVRSLLSGSQDSAEQPPARLPGAGARVRQRAGRRLGPARVRRCQARPVGAG